MSQERDIKVFTFHTKLMLGLLAFGVVILTFQIIQIHYWTWKALFLFIGLLVVAAVVAVAYIYIKLMIAAIIHEVMDGAEKLGIPKGVIAAGALTAAVLGADDAIEALDSVEIFGDELDAISGGEEAIDAFPRSETGPEIDTASTGDPIELKTTLDPDNPLREYVHGYRGEDGNWVAGHWREIPPAPGTIEVDGYYRDNGEWVNGHERTLPDQYEENNISYRRRS